VPAPTLWLDRLVQWLSPPLPPPADLDPRDAIHRQVRAIEVRARTQLRDQFAGDFRSAFRGRGLEFHETRAYVPGDEVRLIDWNVTARRNEPYVKRFVEEREQTVFLLIDASPSTTFGTTGRSVRDLTIELAGLLGLAAALNNDRVGAATFTGDVDYTLRPRKGARHVLRLLHDLIDGKTDSPPAGDTGIAVALDYAARLLPRGAVVFLISDFITDDAWDPALRRLALQHDVVACVVHDPVEAAIPTSGLVTVQDAEAGTTVVAEASHAHRLLAAATHDRLAALAQRFRAAGVDHAILPTDRPYLQPLLALFRARVRRP
jgi:uncharacterized protein (DUF58 family)